MSLSVSSGNSRTDKELDAVLAQPVFLVGAERSGTTLLRLMLNHHPQIRFYHEFEYVVDYVSDTGELPSVADFAERVRGERIFQNNGDVIRADVDYLTLVHGFLRVKLDGRDIRVMGATIHRHMDRLLFLWPNARFIHLVRDPRDVARSRIAMGWSGNTWTGGQAWIEAEASCDRLKSRVSADRWIAMRYEPLVSEPEQELRRLCDFLKLPWDAEMLTYTKNSDYAPPDPSLAWQWRRKATDLEVQLLEARLGPWLTAAGTSRAAWRSCVSRPKTLRGSSASRSWLALPFAAGDTAGLCSGSMFAPAGWAGGRSSAGAGRA